MIQRSKLTLVRGCSAAEDSEARAPSRNQLRRCFEASSTSHPSLLPRCVPAFNMKPKVVMYARKGHGVGLTGYHQVRGSWQYYPRMLVPFLTGHDDVLELCLANIANHSRIFFTPSKATSSADTKRVFSVGSGFGVTADYAVKPAVRGCGAVQVRQRQQASSRRRARGALEDSPATHHASSYQLTLIATIITQVQHSAA